MKALRTAGSTKVLYTSDGEFSPLPHFPAIPLFRYLVTSTVRTSLSHFTLRFRSFLSPSPPLHLTPVLACRGIASSILNTTVVRLDLDSSTALEERKALRPQ